MARARERERERASEKESDREEGGGREESGGGRRWERDTEAVREEDGSKRPRREEGEKKRERMHNDKNKNAKTNTNTNTHTLGGSFIHGRLSVIGYMASVRLFPVLAALARWVLFERPLFLQRAMAYLHLRESCVSIFVCMAGRLLRFYFCTT